MAVIETNIHIVVYIHKSVTIFSSSIFIIFIFTHMDDKKPNKDLEKQVEKLQEKTFKPEIEKSIKDKSKYVNKPIRK